MLETPHYRARLDADGSILSLRDKAHGREIVARGKRLNALKVYHDYPGLFDAWDLLPEYKSRADPVRTVTPLAIESWGPVYLCLRVDCKLKHSSWTQYIRFYRNWCSYNS